MQSKDDLESFYKAEDPWGYKSNGDDTKRKDIIISSLDFICSFNGLYLKNVLDIGCGEGWITKDIPAEMLYGYDLSDRATSRLPENVIKLDSLNEPMKFDLVTTMGTLYKQYNYKWILEKIRLHARRFVLTCNIASWERNDIDKKYQIFEYKFKYRRFTERLAIYDLSLP